MSSLTHPVGPEPERVYWVRRVLVLIALVVLITVFSLIVRSLGRGSTGAAPVIVSSSGASAVDGPSPSVTPAVIGPLPSSAAPTKSAAPAQSAAPTKSAAPSQAPKPSPTAPVACAAADTAVRVNGAGAVKIGQTTSLYVALLSTGAAPCQLDLATFELRIFSGADRIWSTKDCASWLPQGPLTLQPGVASRFAVNWTTQRSSAQCQLVSNLRPGTYVATAILTGGNPSQQVMALS